MYNNDPKYMNPQQGLASLVNSPYGDSDVMQVKMTPNEVAGLQQLAMSYGANEQDLYDPVTGQPRFSFLKKILPMVAGAFLGPGGAGIFKTALGAAAAVGAVTGLVEGDLKKGLMAGLGAYSGAKVGEGLRAAATAPAIEPPPTPSLKDTAFKFSTDPLDQNVPLSTLREAPISTVTGRAMTPVQTVTQAPPMPTPEPPQGMFGTAVQGARNIFTGQEGAAGRFMDALGGPMSRYATLMGGISALTPEQKPLKVADQENIMYIPGGINPEYGTGANQPYQLPGRYYKKTSKGLVPFNPYQMAPGYAAGGQVQDAIPHEYQPLPNPNQNYPLSTVVQANYQANSPQPREIVSGYEPKIDPFTGEEQFADGGEVGVNSPRSTTPQMAEDPIVAANRAYVEQLNRRAMKPEFTPYGMVVSGSGGLGGTNQPWTGTNPYGGPLNTATGGGQPATGGTTDALMNVAAMYGVQKGLGSLMGTPFAQNMMARMGLKTAGAAAGAGGAGTAATGATGAATGATGAATGATGAATGATGATGAGTTAASTGTAGAGTSGTGAASALKGGATPLGTAAAAAAALIGAHQAYQGISKGREGQAAAGGALAGAGGAYLAGASGLGGAGLTSLAGFGPVGLAAAAIAAIGASLVNTKEYGDVALRNYWNAVDKGRGIGQTDPNELAQGFVNFYRTNKNEFAGQAKYGRTGNEDFVYDMTQVINNAVKDGKVNKDVDAATMYKQVVQPWLNSMGEGPKDEKARAIQDFMMTDLINNFMQGKAISNAQVKGDKKFKIVSERPVYAGAPTVPQQTPVGQDKGIEDYIRQNMQQGGFPAGMNPYGQTMGFADGGAIGEDYNFGFAGGGQMPTEYLAGGKLLEGEGDGMSDSIPAVIRGKGVQRAALADGEFVVPADVVSHLGNGSTKAGAKKLYGMMDRIRQARTGTKEQAPAVKTDRLLPA